MILNLRGKLAQLILVFAVGLSATTIASAQTVEYDWNSTSKTPESYPQIRRKQRVTFRIKNVNDILFSYRLEVTQTPIEPDDFALISKLLFPAPGNKALNACSNAVDVANAKLQAAADEISADPKLPVGYAKSSTHSSIPLNDSIAAWHSHGKAIAEVKTYVEKATNACGGDPGVELLNAYAAFEKSVESIDALVNSPHVFIDTYELSPGNNVSATVFELFKKETISSKTFSFPGTDILTLSAGALFTSIPDRSYQTRKTPDSTQNVLAVEGNSRFTPGVVALLNYSLGPLHLDGETTGLALSAGPVVRFGTQSNSSTLGFFAGISGHLYHRIYFTPGIHFGQFADFPVGFHNGSTIPANFGELTPLKRWTGRFGFAITFKAKDFSGLGQSNTASVKSSDSSTATKPNTTSTLSSMPSLNAAFNPKTVSVPASESFSNGNSSQLLGSRSTSDTMTFSSSNSVPGRSLARITYLNGAATKGIDRVIINADAPLRDYAVYFKNSRFYLVIPNASLDSIEDGLRGIAFGDALVEKHGDDLILSFVLQPGARASIAERANGLDLLFAPFQTKQESASSVANRIRP